MRKVVKLDSNGLGLINIYRSLTEAASDNGVDKPMMVKLCKLDKHNFPYSKGNYSLHGFYYMYYDDYESLSRDDIIRQYSNARPKKKKARRAGNKKIKILR